MMEIYLSEQILSSIIPAESEAAKRGVAVRTILPSKLIPPQGIVRIFTREEEGLDKAGVRRRPEVKFIDEMDVRLYMSEKEVAGVCFTTLDGRLDHLEFRGLDERSRGWCKDLFEYYWTRAKIEK